MQSPVLAIIKGSLLGSFCVLLVSLSPCLKAQTPDPTYPIIADTITISSKVLRENRTIYIHYPGVDSTKPPKPRPVLYLLDADNHSGILAEYSRYLSRWDVNVMPELIVVGIVNVHRTRDLTPSHSNLNYMGIPDTSATSRLKLSGGNEPFLQFIREEVIPYVESHYKTQPFKIFAGHSFGGITTINCLLTHPDMFNAYISVSPSFWWDREYVLKLADKKLQKGATLNKIFFYSDGNEGLGGSSTFHTNLLKFDSLLARKQLVGLDYKYRFYPEESHMTEPIPAYYDALRFIYKQWDLPPQDPLLVNSSILMKHYQRLSKKYGYTVLPNEGNTDDWAAYLMKDPATWNNAISLFEMNTINYPTSSKAFVSLGDAYLKKGEKQKAVASYQKAISLNPKSAAVKTKLKALEGK